MRTVKTVAAQPSFRQDASYVQAFWAIREWLVASAIGDWLQVQSPYREYLTAGGIQLTSRLTSQFTIGVTMRVQRNMITGQVGPAASLQLTMKTPN